MSRSRKGEDNPNAKLTADDVATIRTLLEQGHSTMTIARRYGVGQTTIMAIKQGKSWTSTTS